MGGCPLACGYRPAVRVYHAVLPPSLHRRWQKTNASGASRKNNTQTVLDTTPFIGAPVKTGKEHGQLSAIGPAYSRAIALCRVWTGCYTTAKRKNKKQKNDATGGLGSR